MDCGGRCRDFWDLPRGSPVSPISFQEHSSVSPSPSYLLQIYLSECWLAATGDHVPDHLKVGGRSIIISQSWAFSSDFDYSGVFVARINHCLWTHVTVEDFVHIRYHKVLIAEESVIWESLVGVGYIAL